MAGKLINIKMLLEFRKLLRYGDKFKDILLTETHKLCCIGVNRVLVFRLGIIQYLTVASPTPHFRKPDCVLKSMQLVLFDKELDFQISIRYKP